MFLQHFHFQSVVHLNLPVLDVENTHAVLLAGVVRIRILFVSTSPECPTTEAYLNWCEARLSQKLVFLKPFWSINKRFKIYWYIKICIKVCRDKNYSCIILQFYYAIRIQIFLIKENISLSHWMKCDFILNAHFFSLKTRHHICQVKRHFERSLVMHLYMLML